jgi:hypothetical protein
MKKYYNDEASKLIQERRVLWSPELQRETEEKWAALFRDIEAAAAGKVDPASPSAQALIDREEELIGAFTGGHGAIEQGLEKLWADQANWPAEFKKQVFEPFAQRGVTSAQGPVPRLLTPSAEAFVNKVRETRRLPD